MKRDAIRALVVLACAGAGVLAGGVADGALTKKVTVDVPAGWESRMKIEWTFTDAMGVSSIIQVDDLMFVNATDMDKTFEDMVTGPDNANDMHTRTRTKPTPAPAEDAKVGDLNVPFQGLTLVDFLTAGGFVNPPTFDAPLVVADLGTAGVLDALDGSVYASIGSLSAFSTVADDANFGIGTTHVTNGAGQVAGLPGVTFFSDPGLTTPYANGALLVIGTDSTSVPEPAGVVAAVGVMAALGVRRRWG